MKTPGLWPGVHTQMKDSDRLLVSQRLVADLLVVVETTLARLVIALATRRTAAALATRRTTGVEAATRRLEPAWSRRGAAGEICTSVAHRAAVAGRGAAVTTAAAATIATATVAATAATIAAAAIATATAATIAAAPTTTVATTTAAIATATAAAIATTAAVGRTRAAATAAAAKSTTAPPATGLAFDGFTHRDRTAVEQGAVHGLHCCSTHFIGFHFEEGEAAAAAGLAIHDHFRRGNSPELGEGFLQTLGRDGVGQIAHKQFTTHSRLWAGGTNERSPARACWTIASKRLVDL